MGTWQLNVDWREGEIVFDIMKGILQPIELFERYRPEFFAPLILAGSRREPGLGWFCV
jgi:hypothetical protein